MRQADYTRKTQERPKATTAPQLPSKPELSRIILRHDLCTLRDGQEIGPYRWYAGKIEGGHIFAWEPELPHARELVLVTKVVQRRGDEALIYTRALDEPPIKVRPITYREVWNEESRFREAVVPTNIKPQAIS